MRGTQRREINHSDASEGLKSDHTQLSYTLVSFCSELNKTNRDRNSGGSQKVYCVISESEKCNAHDLRQGDQKSRVLALAAHPLLL
jgi:hypothetical protein